MSYTLKVRDVYSRKSCSSSKNWFIKSLENYYDGPMHFDDLEEIYKGYEEFYNVKLIYDRNHSVPHLVTGVEFLSESDVTLFMLKWKS